MGLMTHGILKDFLPHWEPDTYTVRKHIYWMLAQSNRLKSTPGILSIETGEKGDFITFDDGNTYQIGIGDLYWHAVPYPFVSENEYEEGCKGRPCRKL